MGVLQKEDNDWVKKCMECDVDGALVQCQTNSRPKRTWREVVQKGCQARKLNSEDVMDRSRWRKLLGWLT